MEVSCTLLYRGPLSGCNFHCPYCPFARVTDSPQVLREDREALARFHSWLSARSEQLALFFIPRGEALLHSWYRESIAALSHLPHIHKVAMQTNLSRHPEWVAQCHPARIGLWCSYHPSQIARSTFLRHCAYLHARGISHSVGMVGMREHFPEIAAMRAELPADTYLWINAFKRDPHYYAADDIAMLTAIDPLFPLNLRPHASRNEVCRCGSTVWYIEGTGAIQRCPFVPGSIGNIYAQPVSLVMPGDACPNEACRCHIGYAHLDAWV